MKLHLGCGKRNFGENWIHIDCANYPHIRYKDITHLPFDDNTCDLIYASHVLEYFDREKGTKVLKEWYRVLKKNSTIRLAVPDFEIMAQLYFGDMFPLEAFLGPLYGMMIPEGCSESIYHKTTFDFKHLKEMLENVGFRKIKRYDWRQTEHSHFDDHSQAYLPHMDKDNGTLISLNIEGMK
jgi:predicted SAM-dependent methyltransferase